MRIRINLLGKYRRFYLPGKNIDSGLIDSPVFRRFLSLLPRARSISEFIGRCSRYLKSRTTAVVRGDYS